VRLGHHRAAVEVKALHQLDGLALAPRRGDDQHPRRAADIRFGPREVGRHDIGGDAGVEVVLQLGGMAHRRCHQEAKQEQMSHCPPPAPAGTSNRPGCLISSAAFGYASLKAASASAFPRAGHSHRQNRSRRAAGL